MKLKELLSQGQVVAAGAYDCYTSRVMEYAGYQAVVLCGPEVAGLNDETLVTLEDVAWAASRMTIFEEIPVLADIRHGYGESAKHVSRAVQRLEACDVEGFLVDDSSDAIDCNDGIVSLEAWTARVKAAVEARTSSVVIAAVCGDGPIDERIARCKAARELGADMTCIRSLKTREEVEKFAAADKGAKLWYDCCALDNCEIGFEALGTLGFTMIFQNFAAEAAAWGMEHFGKHTIKDKSTVYHDNHDFDGLIPGTSLNVLYNLHTIWIPMEKKFADLGPVADMKDSVEIGG